MKSKFDLTFRSLSYDTLLIEWPDEISDGILSEINSFQNTLAHSRKNGIIESYAAYHTLAVIYDPEKTNAALLKEQITNLSLADKKQVNYLYNMPIRYAQDDDRDMKEYLHTKSLTRDQLIELHSSSVYTVHFIGFLPGFMYLGGLHEKLFMPRKSKPSRLIPKGSVAIGGQQTGIYPNESPGGWHVIGSCPLDFFNPVKKIPCFVRAGDQVRFEPIDEKQHTLIELEVSTETYTYKRQKINGNNHLS